MNNESKAKNTDLVISCAVDFHDKLMVSESYEGLSFNINDETVVIEGLELVKLRDKINLHLNNKL